MVKGPGPSWYDPLWLQRAPVTIDAVTGTSSGTVDVTITVPTAWAEFWSNVKHQANGYDIIVTGPDGRTILNFDLSGFSYANKVCTVRIDGLVLAGTGKAEIVWLYWNNSSQASNLGVVVTITSAITGYIEIGRPLPADTVIARPLIPGQSVSDQVRSKDPNETRHLWWDITDALVPRGQGDEYNDHSGYEGIAYVTPSVAAGATSAVTAAKTRYAAIDGRLYVLTQHTGGATGGTETAYLEIVTQPGHPNSSSRTVKYSCRITIEDGT